MTPDLTKLEKYIDKMINKVAIMQNLLAQYKAMLINNRKACDIEGQRRIDLKIKAINNLL